MPLLQSACRNRVLISLPDAVFNELATHFLAVELGTGLTLHEPGKTVDAVYFLEDGICSIVVTLEDGVSVEVGVIGREGLVGYPVLLGTGQSPHRSFMQVGGYGYRMSAKALMKLLETSPALRGCLLKAVHALMVQTAQTAACNRLHDLNERLARWLLMCSDQVKKNEVMITQEFLAVMLGTGRSSVTLAAGQLQKAGLIEYTRGRVTVKNRAGLEKAACECYRLVHDETVRVGLLEGQAAPPRPRRDVPGVRPQPG